MPRPLIGITPQLRWDEKHASFHYRLAHPYVAAIEAAGGEAALLAPDPAAVAAIVARLDGLLFTGGIDVDPARYGAVPLAAPGAPAPGEADERDAPGAPDGDDAAEGGDARAGGPAGDTAVAGDAAPADGAAGDAATATPPGRSRAAQRRDEFEFALFAAADEAGLPMLAICRGLQLVNVARGGALYQDLARERRAPAGQRIDHRGGSGWHALPEVTPPTGTVVPARFGRRRRRATAPPVLPLWHDVRFGDGARLALLYDALEVRVNSYHHQAVRRTGAGLAVAGRAPDGVVEALESTDQERFLFAVQYHPELLWADDPRHLAPFRALVARARRR